ncbi:MAG: HepT-like ribonuclease domain-containing protein [Acidilobus sp.]
MRLRRQLELVESYYRDFLELWRRGEHVYAVERAAQLLIQSLLDLGVMLAVELGKRKPETYRGVASLLSDVLKLSDDDRAFLLGLAGLRNVLVHGYAKVDRRLEEGAFKEIEARLSPIIGRLRGLDLVSGDPELSLQEIASRLRPVFQRWGIRYAILFGSRAREGGGRDFDIAVSVRLKSALDLGRMIVDKAEALGVHEDLVDVVQVESADIAVVLTLLGEGKVIYGNPDLARDELVRRYLEFLDINSSP